MLRPYIYSKCESLWSNRRNDLTDLDETSNEQLGCDVE